MSTDLVTRLRERIDELLDDRTTKNERIAELLFELRTIRQERNRFRELARNRARQRDAWRRLYQAEHYMRLYRVGL